MTPITEAEVLAAKEQDWNELAYEMSANGSIKGKGVHDESE